VSGDREERLAALEKFLIDHGEMIRTVLGVYAEGMRDEAQYAQAAYEAIKDDPARRAAQDKTLITTHGLKLSAELIADAATRAERALTALADLTDDTDEGE
jgi:hypothetical protein